MKIRRSSTPMIGMVSPLFLSIFAGRNRSLFGAKITNHLGANARTPFAMAFYPEHAGYAGFIFPSPGKVLVVLFNMNAPQVYKAVIGAVSVDVINLLWPLTMDHHPNQAVCKATCGKYAGLSVAINRDAACGLPRIATVPYSGIVCRCLSRAVFKQVGSALPPHKRTRFGGVMEQFQKKCAGDKISLSHSRGPSRMWSGLMKAVQRFIGPIYSMEVVS